jgi:NDP-sugar pyrophosphorylase family protein
MVLGAGLGSRLKPFTEHFPKPLIPVLGIPCIDYSLLSLKDAGISNVVVNVHFHPEKMIPALSSECPSGMKIEISDETPQLLGSAGGFRKALSLLGSDPFFSMNADVLSCVNLEELARRHEELSAKHDVWMTLVLARGEALKSQTGSYREIFVDENSGLVTGFGEKKNQIPFYTGTAVMDPRCFEHLEEGKPAEFVPDVLEPLIQRKKVGFLYSENLWMDVGSPELWWKSHFDLWNAYKQGLLPESWVQAIEKGMKTVYLSEKEGVVDYSLPEKIIGKNYIKLHNIQYAIPSVGD